MSKTFGHTFIILGALLAPIGLSGCATGAHSDPFVGLSDQEAAAYAVLMDQLNQIAEGHGPKLGNFNFCVSLRTPEDRSGRVVNPMLIQRLGENAPASLHAEIVQRADCTDKDQVVWLRSGASALSLSATFWPELSDEQGQWQGIWSCAPLCGGGSSYRIDIVNGRPFARRVGGIAL